MAVGVVIYQILRLSKSGGHLSYVLSEFDIAFGLIGLQGTEKPTSFLILPLARPVSEVFLDHLDF